MGKHGTAAAAWLLASVLAANAAEAAPCRTSGSYDAWLAAFDRERRAMLRNYRAVTRMTLWLADHRRLARGAVLSLRLLPALFSHLLGICGGGTALRAKVARPSRNDSRSNRLM